MLRWLAAAANRASRECYFITRNVQKLQINLASCSRCFHKPVIRGDASNTLTTDETESAILHFPFLHSVQDYKCPFKSLQKPLSIDLATTKSNNGHRIYNERFPSVTTVLKHTKPSGEEWGLRVWTRNQVEEVGREQFDVIKREVMQKGTNFHEEMKDIYSNPSQPPSPEKFTTGYLKSIHHVLPDITNIAAVESAVVHDKLGYAGTVDLIAEYRGILSVIDWKTSKKPKTRLSACHSYPVQVVAYAGAVNYDENYPFQVTNGVLVIAYESGAHADVLVMTPDHCTKYWTRWLQRLYLYKTMHHLKPMDQGHNPTTKHAMDLPYAQSYSNTDRTFPSTQSSVRSVKSIGKPLHQLGRVIPDEELVESFRYSPGILKKLSQASRIFLSAWYYIFIERCKVYFKKKR